MSSRAGAWVVFTDLDNTLLDHETYSFEPAREALDELRWRAIPVVIVTSKTRAEVEPLRRQLRVEGPFIVENGGAVFLAEGSFPFSIDDAVERDGYQVVELGERYERLRAALRGSAIEARCRVRGFGDVTAEVVAEWCGLDGREAEQARRREYDEPFVIDEGSADLLAQAIERRGLLHSRGGRFHHILGRNDKAAAVRIVAGLYRRANPQVRTFGLGDGLNDATFLNEMDEAVLMPSPSIDELARRVPHGIRASPPGPEGWNRMVLSAIRR